jgi:hypothetical protein
VIRPALILVVLLASAGCGTVARQPQRPAADVRWPPSAEAARAQWYGAVEHAAAEPVTLSQADLEDALKKAADAAGVVLVRTHYLPLLGGTAELVVQPQRPMQFAEAGAGVAPLLAPLGRDHRAYLVTVVDERQRPLLMLGWTPGVGAAIGEGIGWQADDIHSGAIYGQPVTLESQTQPALK